MCFSWFYVRALTYRTSAEMKLRRLVANAAVCQLPTQNAPLCRI